MPLPVAPTSGLGTPVTSSDGYLTCIPDSSTASVLIRVNFRGVAGGTPDRVTVTRTINGVTKPVRGLDFFTSPGAVTAGIDHWAPLGKTAVYQATAANSITGQSWVSTSVSLSTPAPSARKGWVKSLLQPSLSISVTVQSWPDWVYAVDQGVFMPLSSPVLNPAVPIFPTVSEGARQAGTGEVTLGTCTVAELQAVRALTQRGGTLLLQTEALHGDLRPDVFVHAGQLQQTAPTQQNPWRRWTFPVVEVGEPPTSGVQVPLPGHTFADSLARWPLLSNRSGTYLDRMIS